jgi:hypothetical protein
VLPALISNLAGCLSEDGLTNVWLLLPARVKLDLDLPMVTCPPEGEIAVPEAPNWDLVRIVLIPVGHVEQHGYQLPPSTDTVIISAIRQACANAAPHLALSLPVMPYGVSTHHQAFPGTINVGGRVFEEYLAGGNRYTGGALQANPAWLMARATWATLANGRIWFETAIAEKLSHLGEIFQQQRHRVARREEKRRLYDVGK